MTVSNLNLVFFILSCKMSSVFHDSLLQPLKLRKVSMFSKFYVC